MKYGDEGSNHSSSIAGNYRSSFLWREIGKTSIAGISIDGSRGKKE